MAQYVEYTDGIAIFRDGVRDGKYRIDKELTPLGFYGIESTDSGATGDWVNIETFE